MRPIARLGAVLATALLVAACGSPATPAPTTPAQPTAGPPTTAPTEAAATAAPTTAAEATCVDVTDAGEATTIEAEAAAFSWSPAEITASVGDVITWTNRDSVGHRVATDDGTCRMDSNIRGGESRSLQFTTAGEYPFYCTLHPDMTGTIIITE